MGRVLFGVLVSLSLAGQAVAAPAIQRGGPKSDADRERLNTALDKLAGVVGVCWRGARPKAVSVSVKVAADGTVESAKAKTKGKVAACAAAVLAVQKLARAAKGYKATIMFPTSGGGGTAGASTRDSVMRGVKTNRQIAACTAKGKRLKGKLNIRFLVKPKGRIVDVEVASSTLSDASMGTCLVKAIGGMKLDLDNKGTVEFVMPFAFDGGGGGEARSKTDKSLQPTKKGPLGTAELSKVMHAARPKFTACYEKQAKKDPTVAGDVVLRYTIRADGTTRNVKIKRTTMNNAAVENCMVRVGKKLEFSGKAGRKETRVVYPFRFSL